MENLRINDLITVTGDLPYYLPFPENITIFPSLIGGESFWLNVEHFNPCRLPEGSIGNKVDDRIGTYIRSRVVINFPKVNITAEKESYYLSRALELTNQLIVSMRYHFSDNSLRPVLYFDHCTFSYFDENLMGINRHYYEHFGIFGVKSLQYLNDKQASDIICLFNGLYPINPARLLVVDAKSHIMNKDYNRAILDLGTALEIHVGWLIEQYKSKISNYKDISLEEKKCWEYYDEVLKSATDHTMREKEDLFIQLEYIRNIRNSVTHEWKPVFRITPRFKSEYIDQHRKRDGTEINTEEKADELVKSTLEILNYVENIFHDLLLS